MDIKLHPQALVPLLQSGEMAAVLKGHAQDIAGALGAYPTHTGEPRVVVETHDAKLSAAASVTVIHPGAEALEQKYGYLRKAAGSAGLKVK